MTEPGDANPTNSEAKPPELAEAERAFERGDYRLVRERCAPLVGASDPAIAAAAKDLVSRTQPDPVQLVIVLLCAVLFCAIAIHYVL